MIIQELLEQLRDQGWSDAEIGIAVGVSRITVFRWRQGQRPENETLLLAALKRLVKRAGPPKRKDLAGTSSARSA